MKYYIIVGEASGDIHGANLMKALKKLDEDAEFRFWGGDKMQNEGGVLVKHIRNLAFMGFLEVLKNLSTIIKNIKFCKKDINQFRPDAVIFIDYPSFNLKIANFTRKKGFKNFFYISPQLWAWNSSRIHSIRKIIDRMFVILPFEKDFYKKLGYDVTFVGHPILDEIERREFLTRECFLEKNKLKDKPIIALLPGSRPQEIKLILGEMIKVKDFYSNFQFVIAATSNIQIELYQNIIGNRKIQIIINQSYNILKHSHAALVTSGTATLEAALFCVPQVVCYKTSYISYEIGRRVINAKFISLVNLILNKEIVVELIQGRLNKNNLKIELDKILNPNNRKNIKLYYSQLRKMLKRGASHNVANEIITILAKSII